MINLELKYIKADPSGNTTVFILDTVARSQYGKIAAIAMSPGYLAAEQVGFIMPSKIDPGSFRMEMMGGEFCGNASRSFAAWQSMYKKDIGGSSANSTDKEISLYIDVSGSNKPLKSKVRSLTSKNYFNVSVCMPIPKWICGGESHDLGEYSIVAFDGINHIVLWNRLPSENDVKLSKDLLLSVGASIDAFGVMFYQLSSNIMTPVVCIKDVGSTIWENSCGSGSSAAAAAIAYKRNSSVDLTIKQPGGNLSVKVDWGGEIHSIVLSGDIRLTSIGTIYIDDEQLL